MRRQSERENSSLPVAVRGIKTSVLKVSNGMEFDIIPVFLYYQDIIGSSSEMLSYLRTIVWPSDNP